MCSASTTLAARVASTADVTRCPQKDRTRGVHPNRAGSQSRRVLLGASVGGASNDIAPRGSELHDAAASSRRPSEARARLRACA